MILLEAHISIKNKLENTFFWLVLAAGAATEISSARVSLGRNTRLTALGAVNHILRRAVRTQLKTLHPELQPLFVVIGTHDVYY